MRFIKWLNEVGKKDILLVGARGLTWAKWRA